MTGKTFKQLYGKYKGKYLRELNRTSLDVNAPAEKHTPVENQVSVHSNRQNGGKVDKGLSKHEKEALHTLYYGSFDNL